MKNLHITITLLLLSGSSFAQYVGIGTTTPGAPLDVKGHIWQTGTGNSVFFGQGAGANDDLIDNKNVFIGYETGHSNTTGFQNTASGYRALYSNTTGRHNTTYGYEALYSNLSGQRNST